MTTRRANRRGLALIPAMVCLTVVTLLGASLFRQSHTHRMLTRVEEARAQADWLAESGLARAVAKLRADPDYRGETWEVSAETLPRHEPGRVRIAVERPANSAGRLVRIEADYPAAGDRRSRRTRTRTISLATEKPGGPS
jgi:type II secretory pathway component PulK